MVNPVVLQATVEESIEQTIGEIIAFLPRLVGAILILLVGWVLGRLLGRLVERLVDAVELDQLVLDTPLGDAMGGSESAVSHTFGVIARWFVYAVAVLAAADVLAIAVLSQWITDAVSYLPAFVAGLLIIVLGFVVADFVGDIIRQTGLSVEAVYTDYVALAVQVFLYFVVIVIGLDTMGIDVGILFVFARALAWGLAAAIAIGAGIAFGLGAQDFVAENIDSWTNHGRSEVTSEESPGDNSGGPGTE